MNDLGAVEVGPYPVRGFLRSGMGSQPYQLGVQGGIGSQKGFQGYGGGGVGGVHEPFRYKQGGGDDRCHGLGSVDEGKTLLCHEHHRLHPQEFEGLSTGNDVPLGVEAFSLPEDGKAHMSQGCQVTRSAQGTPAWDHRCETAVAELHKGIHRFHSYAASSHGQRGDPEKDHHPYDLRRKGLSSCAGVAQEKVSLKEGKLIHRDEGSSQPSKTCVDSVDGSSGFKKDIYLSPPGEDGGNSILTQGELCPVEHRCDLFKTGSAGFYNN